MSTTAAAARVRTRQRAGDRAFSATAVSAGVLILVTLAAVAVFLVLQSLPALTATGETASILRRAGDFWSYVGPLVFGTVWAALLALHLGRLKERGALTPAQISVGKLNSVREALAIAHEARAILAGDGITNAWPVMRHAANLESVRTYEGTDEIHQLILGRELTGLNAF